MTIKIEDLMPAQCDRCGDWCADINDMWGSMMGDGVLCDDCYKEESEEYYWTEDTNYDY